MAATQTRYEFLPFCYERHVEMNHNQIASTIEGGPTQGITFACPEPDCLVHYNSVKGYFMLTRHENGNGSQGGEAYTLRAWRRPLARHAARHARRRPRPCY